MSDSTVPPIDLCCEYRQNPLGIDADKPRLSWKLATEGRAQRQTAYHILVASNEANLRQNTGDLWDSGKVLSDQSIHIAYAGKPLASRTHACWKAKIWDEDGRESDFSAPAWWEMGLLAPSDWSAQWISLQGASRTESGPCPFLRQAFTVGEPVRQARAYASALGVYELSLNGNRVSQDCLLPGWTDYNKRVQYQTFDVTDLIKPGENAAGLTVGDGWYCGPLGWENRFETYGAPPQALAQMEIEYADGTRETIVTDSSWKAGTGPILSSSLMKGETYDARLEMPGWDKAGFDDSAWLPAQVEPIGKVPLVASAMAAVKAIEELPARSVSEPQAGVYIFDIGQNMVGWVRLKIAGEAGQTITLRHAEMLNPDGTLYTENLRSAKATDQYTLRGEGEEVYEPKFTFHGFRYVEMTGCTARPDPSTITGIVAHTALAASGKFECSHPLLNQLQKNIVWGQRGNFLEVPTDCPQRDERLGWMGDAQIFVRTGCFNMDSSAFFTKWMVDVEDAQSAEGGFSDVSPRIVDNSDGAPAWGDAGVIVPWTIYRCYGDTRILEKHYQAMARWVAYIHEANPNLLWLNRRNNDFGDWLSIDADTPKDVLATAYFANDARLLAKIARALGKDKDAAEYEKLFDGIRAAFNAEFVSSDALIKGDTQTAYVLALRFYLLPEALRPVAAERLVDDIENRGGALSTGFVGTGHLLPALTEAGHIDLAYRLALAEHFPSWGYSIKHGATTIWERWDGWTHDKGFQTPAMNSFNHYAFGAIGEWLYSVVAGIELDPEAPGYKRFLLRPRPGGGLTSARAEYESSYGKIVSDWKIVNGQFQWQVMVPPNTLAVAYVPSADDQVTESGQPVHQADAVRFLRQEGGCSVYEIGSGEFAFDSRLG
ncbi:MAG TPA: glycoside hydrolase family 78 protein [Capsulimonadaceae bacterium]|nr:glycoside hydrolase family 78 protein [Capsulimonadaceae bacterium]